MINFVKMILFKFSGDVPAAPECWDGFTLVHNFIELVSVINWLKLWTEALHLIPLLVL